MMMSEDREFSLSVSVIYALIESRQLSMIDGEENR